MFWPGAREIRDILGAPSQAFRDPKLQASRLALSPQGIPRALSGAHGSVFKLTSDEAVTAVKVFHHPSKRRDDRYQLIQDHLSVARPPGIIPIEYQPEGIRVGEHGYPIVLMPWVDGTKLGDWVKSAAVSNDTAAIRRMADQWADLVYGLREARVAHGDLEPRNIIVSGENLVLVDYDGMCVPALIGQAAFENGHPAFQHPDRGSQCLTLDLDHFSAWTILISLRAIAADLSLWKRFIDEPQNESLLFTEQDIRQSESSALWPVLLQSLDPEVRRWSRELFDSLGLPFDAIPPFEFDPFGPMRAALQKRDWDLIAAASNDPRVLSRPVPPDLAGPILEARLRVWCRDEMRKAIERQDPFAARAVCNPGLLDDWPAASDIAREAARLLEAAEVLSQLDVLLRRGEGVQALGLWSRHAPLLASFCEADAIRPQLVLWSARLGGFEALERIVQDGGDRQIVGSWRELQQLGGHPDDHHYRLIAEAAARRLLDAESLEKERSGEDSARRGPPPSTLGPTSGRGDRYRFSAFYSAQIGPGDVGELIACASMEGVPADVIVAHVRKRLNLSSAVPIGAGSSEPQAVARESTIKVTPDVPGLLFDIPLATIPLWEDLQTVGFRFRPVPDAIGHVCHGWIHFWLENVALADVPVHVVIDNDDVPAFFREALSEVNARPYRSVFPSYSHKDHELVERLEAYARSFGDVYLRDVQKLRAGQSWSPELIGLIKRADVFQLFWSENACLSDYVQQEWRQALRERVARPDPYFLRPVYWTPEPAPIPDELRDLHFAKIPV